METEHLLKRRAAIIARHEILESVPGSGCHPNDPRVREERMEGWNTVSKRPVALQNDSDFYIVGDCVAVVRAGLAGFIAKYERDRKREQAEAEATQTDPPEIPPITRYAYKIARKFVTGPPDRIELQSQEFNGVLFCLHDQLIKVVSAGAVS